MGALRRRDGRQGRRGDRSFEPLEGRDLLSIAPLLYAARANHALHAAADVGTPQPTPREAARERFFASFIGRAETGPPRFTDQAYQVFFVGPMTSSTFLRGNLVMRVYVPKDPTQPITGQAAMIVRNVSNTGNELVLDLQGDAQASGLAKPTQLTWTVNGSSGGLYSGATGQGTVTIRYRHFGNAVGPRVIPGAATVIFHGTLVVNGVTNVLRF